MAPDDLVAGGKLAQSMVFAAVDHVSVTLRTPVNRRFRTL